MLSRLIGVGTTSAQLKEGLQASTEAVRGIAHRVANASTQNFADALEVAEIAGQEGRVNIDDEMTALADEHLRFEITANLLQKVYQQIRSSIRER